MKHILLLLIGICFFSCQKDHPELDTADASRIQGEWVELTGTIQPNWKYSFDAGLLTQSYEAFGGVLTTLTFPYATRKDTLFIGGDSSNPARTWVLQFECNEVVKVTNLTANISQNFWLIRE